MDAAQVVDGMFYVLAAVALGGAAGTALFRHIIYAALSLMVSLAGVAGLFVMLGADFVAGVQILVYVGGVLVLTLFAVMLTQGIENVESSNRGVGRPGAGLLVVALVVLVGHAVLAATWPAADAATPPESSVRAVGDALLGPYVLPFELASIVLLTVLVGAVVLSRKETVE